MRPSRCIRQHVVGETRFKPHDIVVVQQTVERWLPSKKELLVNFLSHASEKRISEMDRTFVLALHAIPMEALLKLRLWKRKEDLSFTLLASREVVAPPPCDAQQLSDTLKFLTEEATDEGAVVDTQVADAGRDACLAYLQGQGLATVTEGQEGGRLQCWSLTEAGHNK